MKYINCAAVMFLGGAIFAQDVRLDYSRSTNFSAYKTYHGWITGR